MLKLQIGRLILSSRNVYKIHNKLARQCSILSCAHPNILIQTKKQFNSSDRYILVDITNNSIIDDYGTISETLADLNIFSRLYTLGWTPNSKFYSILKTLDFTYDLETYRHIYNSQVITIDPIGSTDLDDGFSVNFFDDTINLDIHIADPTSYFDLSNPDVMVIFKEISKRISTCYIPLNNKIYHLIPKSDKFDLLEKCTLIGENKRALTFSFVINTVKNTVEFSFKPTTLSDIKNYTYDSYDFMINSDLTYKKKLISLSNFLIKYMGCNLQMINEKDNISHKMIEVFMVGTNYFTGNFLKNNKQTMCVRVQNKNEDSDILPENLKLIKSLGAEYLFVCNNSTEKYYHSTLRIENYCQVSSPMRRFTDMINHFILHNVDINRIIDFIDIDTINQTVKKYKRISNAYDLVVALNTSNDFKAWILEFHSKNRMSLIIYNSETKFKKIIKCNIPVEYIDQIKKNQEYNVKVFYEPEKFKNNIFPFFVKFID